MSSISDLTEVNRRILETMYAAVEHGDFEGVTRCMHEDVVINEPTYLPYAGSYKGIGSFKTVLSAIDQFADVSTIRVKYVVADGDRVIGCLVVRDKTTGKDLELLEQSTLHNGKIVDLRIFYFDAGSMIGAKLQP